MALKNLFDMAKADRYTQDGREAIIKAQEAETEDARRTYQIGEISEATGLQKTAQGWKPPKETKFGKVKQNKEGQWGVQTKQGKGSDFLKHKSEKEASRALANYTAGYNTTERSKQDPHSDQARQVKHWDKETEKIKKENRAEGRAAHAAQFQKPAAQEEIGKFYTKFKDAQSAYDAGRQTFPEGGYKIYNTPQGYKVVDDPKIQQRMEAAGYEVEVDVPEGTKPPKSPKDKPATGSKPDAADQRDQIGGEIKGNLEAAKYYFDKAQSFSPTDPSYKTYMTKAKQYNDEAKTQADDNGFDFEEMHNAGITQAVNKYAEEQSKPDKVGDFLKAYERGDFGKYQQNAEQRKAESFFKQNKDAAPSLSEIVDRVYNIGEISEKTGLQKTANGWRPVKKGAAGKTSRANKEEAIRKDLGLTAGEDMSRFSDEQIEKMYAKTQQTPEQQKADFDKSKIGQAVNKGRQEFAAEKTRQKELASKTNAIGLPKESKPALSQIDGKGNKVEIKITESKGGGFYVDKYVNGKKIGLEHGNTRESAEAKAKSMMEQHMADPDYRAETEPAAGNNLPDIPDFKGMESGDYDNKLRAEGWTTGGWEGNGTHASAIFKKGDRTIRVNEGQPGKITSVQEISKPAAENKTVEKFDIEKWKTGPKVEKNSKLDWSHGVVGKSISVQGKSAEEKRNLINKYNSVGRLSRIGTKKNSYYNNKHGTFEVAGIDNDNVYIQEERSNGMGSRYMALVTIPLNEVEEINPFHDYGKRNPETGEESPTRPPLPEDAAPRVLTGDTKIRVRK